MYDLSLIVKCMAKKLPMNIEGHIGLIRAIEMEDGSGKNYNIRMLVGSETITVFVKASLTGM
jgi:hypothetical protein